MLNVYVYPHSTYVHVNLFLFQRQDNFKDEKNAYDEQFMCKVKYNNDT